MALTISVGFVVDDAIVMLENITRHIEEGLSPLEAAFQGAGEISFTIVSISVSLIAVLIPLLLMGGIVGRLFHEFAVTLAMTILVSGFTALTVTPTLASRVLKPPAEMHHGRLYLASERAFTALLNGYEWALDRALRHRFVTLLVFFAGLAASIALFVAIPKGFFPQQDTGLIIGQSEAAQDISSSAMLTRQEALGAVVQKDPDVQSVGMSIGGNGRTTNNGQIFITLKPRDQRTASAQQIIARLDRQLAKVPGGRLYLQASQDVRVGGRSSRTQYQYTLVDSDLGELNTWAPKVLTKLQTVPELTDVATDQQTNGTTLTLSINRDEAARFGITPQLIDDTLDDAFGQRQVAQFFTQLNTYYVIMEILPQDQGKASALNDIYVKSPTTGADVPLSSFVHWTTVPVQPLSISHQGQFPAVTISFNLAPNVSLGAATQAISAAGEELQLPATFTGSFEGTAQAFQQSLSTVPLLILAALVTVYLILGVLYESYIHPITILLDLCPLRVLGALATLMIAGFDFSLIALIGIILLIGIVKKNGIMMVDFAIVGERELGLSSYDAIRRAALLRFRPIMMTTMAALLGALPLMLGTGTGSELRQPLGYSMVGGLIVSQALTLFTTPVVYLYLDQMSQFYRDWRRRRRTVAAKEPKRESSTGPEWARAAARRQR